MKAYVAGEITIFLWSFLSGMIIMLLYDLINCIFTKQRCSVVVYNICDSVFIICACAIMIFVLFSVSDGYVRAYEFVGAFLGGILYKFTFSRFVSAFFVTITEIFFAIFAFFLKILLTPVKFMFNIIYNTISVFLCFIRKMFSFLLHQVARFFRFAKASLRKI